MRVRKIIIEDWAQEKILGHGLKREEVENGLFLGKPKFLKDRHGRYLAITNYNLYITIVFEHVNFNAKMITAYPSSGWQMSRTTSHRLVECTVTTHQVVLEHAQNSTTSLIRDGWNSDIKKYKRK